MSPENPNRARARGLDSGSAMFARRRGRRRRSLAAATASSRSRLIKCPKIWIRRPYCAADAALNWKSVRPRTAQMGENSDDRIKERPRCPPAASRLCPRGRWDGRGWTDSSSSDRRPGPGKPWPAGQERKRGAASMDSPPALVLPITCPPLMPPPPSTAVQARGNGPGPCPH